MKVYIHFEDPGGLSHSMGCEFKQDSSTPMSLINNFIQSYNLAHPKRPLAAKFLCLTTSDGKKLSSSTIAELSDREDIIISEINPQSSGVLPVANSNAKKEGKAPELKVLGQQLNSVEIATYKKDIEDLIAAKSYRKARILAEKCLTLVSVESYFFFNAIAQIKLANEEFESAVKYSSLAVTAAGKASADASIFKFSLARALYMLGDRFEEADEILEKMEKMLSNQLPSHLPKTFKLDVRVLRAECLFDLNQHEAAANLVNGHMHWTGAEEHLPTLIAYTRFAMTYRKVEEPVRAMLKAVVLDQNNALCRKMLAELLSSDAGYKELVRQVPLTPLSAAAYAFVARVIKDCSAMQPCIKLLTEALKSKPDSASFVLNLSHTHEIM
jgi:tetratricopeptide (TPR) repeat protein